MSDLLTCSNEEWYKQIKAIIEFLTSEQVCELNRIAQARYELEPFYRNMNFMIDNDEWIHIEDGRFFVIPSATSGNETVRLHSNSTLSVEEWYKQLDVE